MNSSQKKHVKIEQNELSVISKSMMTDVKKLKILTVFSLILEEKLKIQTLMLYKIGFDELKLQSQKLSFCKFGFLKLSSFFNKKQKTAKRDFFAKFNEIYAKKFRNYMKGIIPVKKLSNSSIKPCVSHKKLSVLVAKMMKMTRDLINDEKAEDFRINSKDLKILIVLQRGLNLLSFFQCFQRRKILQTAFKTIHKRIVKEINEDEITGVKDFSHYSIILHPAYGEKNNQPGTKLIRTPNKQNR